MAWVMSPIRSMGKRKEGPASPREVSYRFDAVLSMRAGGWRLSIPRKSLQAV